MAFENAEWKYEINENGLIGCTSYFGGVKSQKSSSETGRESSLRLGHSTLSTGNLRGVAGKEVVHGLTGVEDGDRGEDTKGITSQKEDSLGVVAKRILLVTGDVEDGV